MELALTLASMVSFFVLVITWAMLPASKVASAKVSTESISAPAASPQVAH